VPEMACRSNKPKLSPINVNILRMCSVRLGNLLEQVNDRRLKSKADGK
jgi:hypothetical protein